MTRWSAPSWSQVIRFALYAMVGLILATALLALVISATTSSQIRETQVDNTSRSMQTAELVRRIRSCTTPGQPCYERGRRQTAKAVGDVNRVVVLAAYCASRRPGQSVEQIAACVTQGLAKPAR